MTSSRRYNRKKKEKNEIHLKININHREYSTITSLLILLIRVKRFIVDAWKVYRMYLHPIDDFIKLTNGLWTMNFSNRFSIYETTSLACGFDVPCCYPKTSRVAFHFVNIDEVKMFFFSLYFCLFFLHFLSSMRQLSIYNLQWFLINWIDRCRDLSLSINCNSYITKGIRQSNH